MPHAEVRPVVDMRVRGLCARPYPLHPRGCPNFRKKRGCPPDAPKIDEIYDLSVASYAIWNVFPLGEHVAALRAKHPSWSERQLYCCLYWQPRARAQLEVEIEEFIKHGTRLVGATLVVRCPEAMGLDVTATMRSIRLRSQAALPPAQLRGRVWEPSQGSQDEGVRSQAALPPAQLRGMVWEPSQGSQDEGVELPWPPLEQAVQVAFAGVGRGGSNAF